MTTATRNNCQVTYNLSAMNSAPVSKKQRKFEREDISVLADGTVLTQTVIASIGTFQISSFCLIGVVIGLLVLILRRVF